jgi:N-acetyl-gamma-glutamyl-phosphate reductase
MAKTKVGIINATGYVGAELARLLTNHPEVELTSVTGRSAAGRKLDEVFPHLAGLGLTIKPELDEVELAFSAMPHKESAKKVMAQLEQGVKVVDISADFRLKDPGAYPCWYGFSHPSPELLKEAIYGLTELNRQYISTSTELVANPGCYPTGAILALAPLAKEGLTDGDIIIDSKSGISGAGRSLKLANQYSEADEDTAAYALEGHRHLPEITQELNNISDAKVSVTFVPHLVPMNRGILTTCYAKLVKGKEDITGQAELKVLYNDFYKDEPFVKIAAEPPHTKHTWGSNLCLIFPTIDIATGRLVIISAIDNLVKGAAGQAVQNMNLMLDLPETTGLTATPVFP